jgi:hypothetical protein
MSPPEPYPNGVFPPERLPEETLQLCAPGFPTPYMTGPQAPGPFAVAKAPVATRLGDA